MHFKAIVALAAAVASVNADAPKNLQPAGNGALDLSGKGLSYVGKRSNAAVVNTGNIALHGATPFRSALDFNQISKPNPQKRAAPAAADNEPWVPEWQPGQEYVQEIPESEETSAAPAQPTPQHHDPHGQDPQSQDHQAHGQATPTTTTAQRAGATPSKPAQGVPTPQQPAGDHTVQAAGSSTTPAPSTGGSTGGSGSVKGGKGALTFNIVNKMSGEITISYQLGTYSPASGGPTTVASQLLGIGATTGTFAQSTQVVAPVGWAGRMTIGKSGAELDYRGTKIEGNNGFDGADPNADPDPDVDISYVDGYSVPASCSCGSTVLSGCNKELFDLGNTCDNLAGDSNHKVCVNEPRNAHGPASPFFAPCANAAYTYDYNDVANWQGTCAGNVINCCIGTDCPAPTRQSGGKTKREVLALMGARRRSAMAAA